MSSEEQNVCALNSPPALQMQNVNAKWHTSIAAEKLTFGLVHFYFEVT